MPSLGAHDHCRRVLRIQDEVESLENGFVREWIVRRGVVFGSEVEQTDRVVFEELLTAWGGFSFREDIEKAAILTSSRSDLPARAR